ncbi:Acg family FMN-binding oxidoreductase [Promicromonospora soli]
MDLTGQRPEAARWSGRNDRAALTWLIKHVVSPTDRLLLRLSGGRLRLTVGRPVLLLSTVGLRTGRVRRTPVFYLRDGDELVVCNVRPPGERPNPWPRNLDHEPAAEVTVGGHRRAVTARRATDREAERLWPELVRRWPLYDDYYRGTRERHVFVLTPRADPTDPTDPPNGTSTSMDARQAPPATGEPRPVSRRRFLGMVGLGTGTVAVLGASGLTWRAVDQGVFATATGPAYAAWEQGNPPGDDVLNLVRAAVLAASAHNTQPWLFRLGPDRIDLYADTARSLGTMDPLRREMDLSLGCALENLVLAGPPNRLSPAVALLPDPAQPAHVARVALDPATAATSPLFAAIADRHTNRAAYDIARSLPTEVRDALTRLVDVDTTRLVWFADDVDKRAFADLTVRATRAIIADPQQADDDYAWYRTTWSQVQSDMDGVTIDASGQPPLIRAVAKLLGTTREQNSDGWLRSTVDTQLPTAAAFGILVVRDPIDTAARIQTGRVFQRMHLWATTRGLAVQPLNQVSERIDRERSAGLAPDLTRAMAELLPAGWHPVMAFRTGYPTTDALPSPRRPAERVVQAGQ